MLTTTAPTNYRWTQLPLHSCTYDYNYQHMQLQRLQPLQPRWLQLPMSTTPTNYCKHGRLQQPTTTTTTTNANNYNSTTSNDRHPRQIHATNMHKDIPFQLQRLPLLSAWHHGEPQQRNIQLTRTTATQHTTNKRCYFQHSKQLFLYIFFSFLFDSPHAANSTIKVTVINVLSFHPLLFPCWIFLLHGCHCSFSTCPFLNLVL